MDINFEPKNFATSSDKEFYGAREAKIINSTNYIESIKEKWFKELFVSVLLVVPFLLLML